MITFRVFFNIPEVGSKSFVVKAETPEDALPQARSEMKHKHKGRDTKNAIHEGTYDVFDKQYV